LLEQNIKETRHAEAWYGQLIEVLIFTLIGNVITTREFNWATHGLPKEAYKQVIERSWTFDVLRYILDIVFTEQFALSLS
jgi:hypothetical protein